jgi:hypothetical protein
MNAANSAAFLSGNGIGSIIPIDTVPKITPLISPDITLDINGLIRPGRTLSGNLIFSRLG